MGMGSYRCKCGMVFKTSSLLREHIILRRQRMIKVSNLVPWTPEQVERHNADAARQNAEHGVVCD